MRTFPSLGIILLSGSFGLAQGAPVSQAAAPASQHVAVAADAVKWGPAPPSMPSGAQFAVLDGDPAQSGLFALRIKLPAGYRMPPHWHPVDEHLTVISGAIMMGVGEKFDKAAAHKLAAGDYSKMPKETRHFVWTDNEAVLQLNGMGPFQITYVNASDDPRKPASPGR